MRQVDVSSSPRDTNWHTMLYLVRLTFSIAAGSSKAYDGILTASPCPAPSDSGKALLQQSRALFRGLADDSEKGLRERGFLLALLEIEKESRLRAWDESAPPSRLPCHQTAHVVSIPATPLSNLVAEYFERFSTKMCCHEDLRPYLEVLTPAERAAFRETVVAVEQTTDLVCPLLFPDQGQELIE